VEITPFRSVGLGDSTYLVAHDGVGILVDPQRDSDRFLESADASGVRIRYVLETHLHNDYISGGREAARRSGARLVLPAAAGAAFDHVPAFHLEDLEAEALLTIRPIHTPGHTPEHVSYLILLDRQPVALFSGGSLLAGAAGRTDLLGRARAEQLGVLQFGSLRRLAALPEELPLYPTHGAGSFCSATAAAICPRSG
jgi:glyoxylase-like metal-dependent hydrolase (beta-lactamase superfamily II)